MLVCSESAVDMKQLLEGGILSVFGNVEALGGQICKLFAKGLCALVKG